MKHAIKIEDLDMSEKLASEYEKVIREFLRDLGYSMGRIDAFECRRRDGFIPNSYNKGGLEGVCYRSQFLSYGATGFKKTDAALRRRQGYDLESFLIDKKTR